MHVQITADSQWHVFVWNTQTLFERCLEQIGQSTSNYEFLANQQNACASDWWGTRLQAKTLFDVVLIQTQTTYEGEISSHIAPMIWLCRNMNIKQSIAVNQTIL